MYMERFRYEKYVHVKWTQEDEQRLLELVEQQRKNGSALNYEELSAQLGRRYPWSIHNKLLQLEDVRWTPVEEELLGKCWERNHAKIAGPDGQNTKIVTNLFPKHSPKMVLFKLE